MMIIHIASHLDRPYDGQSPQDDLFRHHPGHDSAAQNIYVVGRRWFIEGWVEKFEEVVEQDDHIGDIWVN